MSFVLWSWLAEAFVGFIAEAGRWTRAILLKK